METAPAKVLDFLHFHFPTAEQKNVLELLNEFIQETNAEDFFILCGAAGTGKTSITAALVNYLNHFSKEYRIAAPTGRAARILGRKTKSVSSTIHSLIYRSSTDKESGEVVFTLKENKLREFCIYIIDEASMIPSRKSGASQKMFQSDNSLLNDLVSFIKNGNSSSKVLFQAETDHV